MTRRPLSLPRSSHAPLAPFALLVLMALPAGEHAALQRLDDIRFLETENDALIAYAKSVPGDTILCVVNLDPGSVQVGVTIVPAELGLPPAFDVVDLLTDDRFTWHTGRNYVSLDPAACPAHVLHVVTH